MADEADLQDEEFDDEEEEGGEKKKSGLGLPAIIGIVFGAIALQAALVFLIFTLFLKEDPPPEEEARTGPRFIEGEVEQYPDTVDIVIRQIGPIIPVKELMANPLGEKKKIVLVDLAIEFYPVREGEEEEEPEEGAIPADSLEPSKETIIRSQMINMLSTRTVEQLQQPATRDKILAELKRDIQPYFGERLIRRILFSKFLIN